MSETVARLIQEINRLEPADRAEIASAVLSELRPEAPITDDAFEANLSRRIAEIQSGAVEGKSADEVFARLRAKRS